MTIPAWWLVAAVVPVLWLGREMVRRVAVLRRLDLPPVIVGGLCVAGVILALNLCGVPLKAEPKVASAVWLWPVNPETQWNTPGPIFLPFSTAFFACVGLLAGWGVAKQGSWQIALLLLLATVLGGIQNYVGVTLAGLMDAPPALGVACGSLTLTGGPSTALARVEEFEKAGLANVQPVALASAMFGIVTASLLAAAVGGRLVRWFKLTPPPGTLVPVPTSDASPHETYTTPASASPTNVAPRTPGLFGDLSALRAPGANVLLHVAVILFCVKAGAWLGLGYKTLSAHFRWPLAVPVYMGALVLAIVVRNATDAVGPFRLNPRTIDALAGIVLRVFLAMAIAGLSLIDLKSVAGPMGVILPAQLLLTVVFAASVTFVVMGRDYDAAVMATGHVGFGLGITPNAVASMDALTDKFGPAPRAVLVVTIVGGFLIDVTNTFLISFQLPHAN